MYRGINSPAWLLQILSCTLHFPLFSHPFIVNCRAAQACFTHMFSHDSNYNVLKKVRGYANGNLSSIGSSGNSSIQCETIWGMFVTICPSTKACIKHIVITPSGCQWSWNVMQRIKFHYTSSQYSCYCFIGLASKQITQNNWRRTSF